LHLLLQSLLGLFTLLIKVVFVICIVVLAILRAVVLGAVILGVLRLFLGVSLD
jgi:hypothetical protein